MPLRSIVMSFAAGRVALALLAATVPIVGCGEGGGELAQSFVSPQEERELGNKAWAQLLQETPRSSNAAYQREVEQVAERVVAASDSSIPADQWDFTVFQGDDVNAFALPGGHVGVYEGMFKVVQSPDQLAAVIGHEVSHVTQRHAAQRIGTQELSQLGIAVASTALDLGQVVDARTAQALLGAGAQYGILLPFSRGQETEADVKGLMLMAKACYDPEAAVAFWQRMARAGGAKPPAFLSTHPTDADRIARIREALPDAQEAYRENCG